MLRAVFAMSMIVVLQAGPYAQGRGKAAAPTRETSVRVMVHDADGASLDGARVSVSGDASAEFVTAGAGMVVIPNLAAGTYRIRAEKDGFITLEREFTLKAGTPSSVDLVLKPQPPAPAPPPPPAPRPATADALPSGAPVNLVVADFVDKNFIGREPIKESVLACKPLEVVRLLQMREAIAAHAHAEGDELIYVIAGEGSARIGEEVVGLRASSLVVVPRGLSHQIERRGKNPLIMLSTLTGEPCADGSTSK